MSIEILKDDILEVVVEDGPLALWAGLTLAQHFFPSMPESDQVAGLRVAIRDLLAGGFIRLARLSSYDRWTVLNGQEANAALEDSGNLAASSEFPWIGIVPTAQGEKRYLSSG